MLTLLATVFVIVLVLVVSVVIALIFGTVETTEERRARKAEQERQAREAWIRRRALEAQVKLNEIESDARSIRGSAIARWLQQEFVRFPLMEVRNSNATAAPCLQCSATARYRWVDPATRAPIYLLVDTAKR